MTSQFACDESIRERAAVRFLLDHHAEVQKQIAHGRSQFFREPVRLLIPPKFRASLIECAPVTFLGLSVEAYSGRFEQVFDNHDLVFVEFAAPKVYPIDVPSETL